MKFQPGDKVRYLDEGLSGGPETGKVYIVSRRDAGNAGVHLEGFNHDDWWLDRRFELCREPVYLVLTENTYEIPSGAFNPSVECFTEARKFNKEELKTWLEKNHNSSYEVFKCTPITVTVRSTVEIEE